MGRILERFLKNVYVIIYEFHFSSAKGAGFATTAQGPIFALLVKPISELLPARSDLLLK